MDGPRAHRVTAVLALAFAALVAWQALGLRLYTAMGPGPGFFPFWLALLFGALAAGMLAQARRAPRAPGGEGEAPGPGGYRRVAVVVGALIGATLLLEPLGFRLTVLGFYLVLLQVGGRPSWPVAVAVALAGSFGVYHLWTEVLAIPLPVGRLGL
jgi:putative tricarboxylic transport membrane protein